LSDVPPLERLRQLRDHLRNIGGNGQTGMGPKKVRSLPDGVGKAIEIFLKKLEGNKDDITPEDQNSQDPTTVAKVASKKGKKLFDLCPSCGSFTLVHESGCENCTECGYSRC
jgi:ribonucleoside-diphosphate reductase alpha chain